MLLESLGYHDSQSMDTQRSGILEDYSGAVTNWLAQNQPENATDSMVRYFLGKPTDNKVSFAAELVSVLKPEEPSITTIRELCTEECQKTRGESILNIDARPFNCLNCQETSQEIPRCPCAYSMILNAGLIYAGASEQQISLYKIFALVRESILAYAIAINSWLVGVAPQDNIWPTDMYYLKREDSTGITERVHSSLGEKDAAKEWLTTCLLKTIKDNQRWFQMTEPIDSLPEATSWLKEMSGL